MEPIPRVTARVLPVCPDGEVLLLQERDPAVPDVSWWGTVGGAVDAGETLEEAAVREMREETGLVVEPGLLTGPFRRGTHEFSWDGTRYLIRTSFFALALGCDAAVSFDNLVPEEVGNVLGWRWWSPADVAADGRMVSEELPEIMTAAIEAVLGRQS